MPAKATTKAAPKQRQAPDHKIESWARALCATGDNPQERTAALLLLLDEFAECCHDFSRVDEIAWIAKTSVFGKSAQADKAMRDLVATLRTQRGLRLVKGGK